MTARRAPAARGARATALLAGLGLWAGVAGCRPSAEAGPSPVGKTATAAAPSPAESAPVDHLGPGELVEGTETAFGVRLPRDIHLEQAFRDVAYARGSTPLHPLVTYFRARLRDGSLREGEESATFEHVHAPALPNRELSVHITASSRVAGVVLRDTTPLPLPVVPDEAAMRRQVGLGPDGRWLDPTHLD